MQRLQRKTDAFVFDDAAPLISACHNSQLRYGTLSYQYDLL
jgi:hypothetical protein